MVTPAQVDALADFARLVDSYQSLRAAVAQSPDLDAVARIAQGLGFKAVTPELLEQVSERIGNPGWVWSCRSREWHDRVYVFSLSLLFDKQDVKPESDRGEGSASFPPAVEQELRHFFEYMRTCPQVQVELLLSKSRREVVGIAAAHGFLITEAALQRLSCSGRQAQEQAL